MFEQLETILSIWFNYKKLTTQTFPGVASALAYGLAFREECDSGLVPWEVTGNCDTFKPRKKKETNAFSFQLLGISQSLLSQRARLDCLFHFICTAICHMMIRIKREKSGQSSSSAVWKEQSPASSTALWWYWEFPGIWFSCLQLPATFLTHVLPIYPLLTCPHPSFCPHTSWCDVRLPSNILCHQRACQLWSLSTSVVESVSGPCLPSYICVYSVIWIGYFPSMLLQSMVGFLSLFFFSS